jgi:hypothetical protein
MATHEDAQLIIAINQWTAQAGIDDSMAVVWGNDFDPAAAEPDNKDVIGALKAGETLGTLVKHDVLDAELVLDLWAVRALWERVGPAAMKSREATGEPRMWENFEALAARDDA